MTDHLSKLESKSVHILREAYAAFGNLCMLWSIGKDSTVLLWLARKAFYGERGRRDFGQWLASQKKFIFLPLQAMNIPELLPQKRNIGDIMNPMTRITIL